MNKYNFRFGNHWLSEYYGVTVERPQIEVAERDIQLIDIQGRSGSECIDFGRYKNVEMTRQIGFPQRKGREIQGLTNKLIDWFASIQGYQSYEDTDHPGMITEAVITNFSSVVRQLQRIQTTTIKMSRKPFWYDKHGLEYLTSENLSYNLVNQYAFDAQPLIKIVLPPSIGARVAKLRFTFASGQTIVKTFTVSTTRAGSSQYILIDTEKALITLNDYDGTRLSYLGTEAGFIFPALSETVVDMPDSGNNVESLDIMPKWRRV